MDKATTIHFGDRLFELDTASLDEEMFDDLRDCGGGGDQTANVKWFLERHKVTADKDIAISLLSGYGAWDDDQLSVHSDNIERLVWLVGSDIRENESLDQYEDQPWDGWIIMESN